MEVLLEKPRCRRPFDYYLLWLAVLVSLGIHVYLINLLLDARRQVADAAAAASVVMRDIGAGAIDYPVDVRDTIPVSLTVRYHETITVPISYTMPINTQVSIPLRTPLGTFPINVPVVSSIPISLSPSVPLSLAVPISLTVPIAVDVPIHVELGDTPLGQALEAAERYFLDLAESLRQGPGPFLPRKAPEAASDGAGTFD